MIASLPMYWRPENAAAWQAFWQIVQHEGRAHGLSLPDLTPPQDLPANWINHWLRPDLALSMTCGLPFRTTLRGRVAYVGTLGFGLQTQTGHYFSRVLTRFAPGDPRRDDPLHRVLAFNAPDS
jgi:hypothetical protein